MIECRSYTSRLNDPTCQKFGTFSYLPAMDASRVRKQIQYILEQGWNSVIEHVEPDRVTAHYWYMWKLPLFGVRDVDPIVKEITACREANPGHFVRIVGYDNARQRRGHESSSIRVIDV